MQRQQKMHALVREHERIDGAGLTAIAFHDPKQLSSIEQRLMAQLEYHADTPVERENWRKDAEERVRRLHTVRLIPEELPSG